MKSPEAVPTSSPQPEQAPDVTPLATDNFYESDPGTKFAARAQQQEKTLLEKLSDRANNATRAFMLVSALVFGAEGAKVAQAAEPPSGQKIERVDREKSPEARAVAFITKIYNLPGDPAKSEAQNKLDKKKVTRVKIQGYALERKGVTSGHVSPQDTADALAELRSAMFPFADKVLGNHDGKIDDTEKQKLKETMSANPGLQEIKAMYEQYRDNAGK